MKLGNGKMLRRTLRVTWEREGKAARFIPRVCWGKLRGEGKMKQQPTLPVDEGA